MKYTCIKYFAVLSAVLLLNCKSSKKAGAVEEVEYDYGRYLVNYGGCVGRDSLQLRTIDNRDYTSSFYKDQNNRLYFRTFDRSDETGKKVTPVFIRRFPNDCQGAGDSIHDIGKTIDLATLKGTGNGYYKDKKNTYRFMSFADGGQFLIESNEVINYKKAGKGFYKGSDGEIYIRTKVLKNVEKDEWSNFFYRMVPSVDIETYSDFGQIDGYAKDKNNVYWRRGTTDGDFIDVIKKADAASFTVIEPRFLAKDKNYVYEQWNIVKGARPDSINTKEDLDRFKQNQPKQK